MSVQPEFRVYHTEYGMLYPGHFRLKYNRDKQWHVLVPEKRAGAESPKLWTMMQSLGFKDKNGVTIYADDIVDIDYGGLARIEATACGFEMVVDELDARTGMLDHFGKYMTVVGNIHENKDLIVSEAVKNRALQAHRKKLAKNRALMPEQPKASVETK